MTPEEWRAAMADARARLASTRERVYRTRVRAHAVMEQVRRDRAASNGVPYVPEQPDTLIPESQSRHIH